MNSRNKGARGERFAARYLSILFGTTFRRGVQHSGSPDSPDIKAEDANFPFHIEVKYGYNIKSPFRKGRFVVVVDSRIACVKANVFMKFPAFYDIYKRFATKRGKTTVGSWMDQAVADCGDKKIPLVFYKPTSPSMSKLGPVIMFRLEDEEKVKEALCQM